MDSKAGGALNWVGGALVGLVLLGAVSALGAAPTPDPPPPDAAAVEFFEKRVRPVLAERCYSCHGPKLQQGGLRLDVPGFLRAGADGGPVVRPGDPAGSRLMQAVRHEGGLKMPPSGRLPAAEIDALAAWVKQGAVWPAASKGAPDTRKPALRYGPLHRSPPAPKVRSAGWVRTPIDAFILSELEKRGLKPAPAADRRTLIRRAYYDLVGLPPTADAVDAFVADRSPDAYPRLVDRLLASPQYGERWGRYWLDVARYAETKGYVRLQEERNFPYAFTYRDYVVRAFNEDKPYDRFILEQLAADQLPGKSGDAHLAALGFLTLGRRFTGNRHDIIDDRIDVVSRGVLGLTVTCARCHDHKYDAIPTADYYSLYGVFAGSNDPTFPQPIGPATPKDAVYLKELERRVQAVERVEAPAYEALLDGFRSRAGDYLIRALDGRQPPQQPLPKTHEELRQVVVERWIDTLQDASERVDPVFEPWTAFARLEKAGFREAASALIRRWQAGPVDIVNPRVLAHFAQNPPASMQDVARGYGELLEALHARRKAQDTDFTPDERQLLDVLYGLRSPIMVTRDEALEDYLYDAPVNAELFRLRNEVGAWLARTTEGPPRAHTLVEREAAGNARILVRGNPQRPGRQVPRQFLSVLSGAQQRKPFAPGKARLELAQEIVRRDNPLTARVFVNRVWMHHFGAGLVRTPSDFGARGDAPTHPALLDWLAGSFTAKGSLNWSIKKLHRVIMLSNAYQQSSDSPAAEAADPENRLLGRMNRRRLDVEALRDSMLAAAGKLDLRVGGPSIDLLKPENTRRTLYAAIDRQNLPGILRLFDFANPDVHTAQRHATTVPLQALFLLNSAFMMQTSRALAERSGAPGVNPAERLRCLYRCALGRNPTAPEAERGLRFLELGGTWPELAQALLLSNEFAFID